MSELIAILLITVGQLLGTNAAPDQIAGELQAAVETTAPMPLEDLAVTVTEETTENGDPLGTWLVAFDFDEIFLEPVLVDELEITVTGLTLAEDGTVRLGGIDFSGKFTAESLTTALREKKDTLSDASVALARDGITLSGKYATWVGRVPFSVKGNLSVENQTQLIFAIDKSSMIGIPIPGPVNRLVQHEVNPVYNLDAFVERSKKDIQRAKDMLDYEFYLQVEEITPGDGHIIVTGNA